MKKIFLFLAVVVATIFSSCEGPEGPQGPTGFNAESAVYEITGVNFLPNSFGILYTFPNALPSDHVLVYRLWANDGGADVWRLIPQTVYFDNGDEFDYNYDHTQFDVNIFLDGNFDLNTLDAGFTQNQIFRVVVIPGQFANKSVDMKNVNTDYDAVVKAYNIKESDVKKVKATKNI